MMIQYNNQLKRLVFPKAVDHIVYDIMIRQGSFMDGG